MDRPVLKRSRLRAVRVLLIHIGVLGLTALIISTEIWWLDVAYLGLVFTLLFVFSGRALFAKWRRSEAKDVTKHGPTAALPDSWRRWLFDDYPENKTKS